LTGFLQLIKQLAEQAESLELYEKVKLAVETAA